MSQSSVPNNWGREKCRLVQQIERLERENGAMNRHIGQLKSAVEARDNTISDLSSQYHQQLDLNKLQAVEIQELRQQNQ